MTDKMARIKELVALLDRASKAYYQQDTEIKIGRASCRERV